MRFSGLLWWISAVVFALLAGILTYGLLSNSNAGAPSGLQQAANTRPVVVATLDIPFRRSITESELEIRELPVDSIPEGAAESIDQVVGKMSTVDVFASEPLLMQQLVTPDIVTQQVALSIPKGKIVTSVPTKSELITNRLIRPGDHIDLMATFDVEVIRQQGSSPMPESIALLQNLDVHAIILPKEILDAQDANATSEGGVFRTPADKGQQSVLLAVDPQDALAIRHILDVGGKLDLALRAPGDDTASEPVVVDQFYLAERYQIELVRGNLVNLSPYPSE
ncbi:MAG: Flp pilus assembly protein CpaB [Caldilineaceae bacterium]